MKKKIIVILDICIVLAIICVCVFGKKTFDNYKVEQQQMKIAEKQTEIQNLKDAFEQETDRTQKLNILKNTQESYTEYKKSKDINDDCKKLYESTLAFEKKYFMDDYDNIISLNTILNIAEEIDTNKMQECSAALTELKNTIKTEYDMYDVVTEEKYMEYITMIDGFLTSYTERERLLAENSIPEKEDEDEQKEETTKEETTKKGNENETEQKKTVKPKEKKKKKRTPPKADSFVVDNSISGSNSASDDINDNSNITDDTENNNDWGHNDDTENNGGDNSDENDNNGGTEDLKPESEEIFY